MILIVGLGNPGTKYINTRHNIGFRVLDAFQEQNEFPEFELKKSFNALVSKAKINDQDIVLAKPQTFMNSSGKAAAGLLKDLTKKHPSQTSQNPDTITAIAVIVRTNNLVVIHDDIDLKFGKIRVSQNKGSAGHKGVESIIKELDTKDFIRIRIGIQPEKGKPAQVEKFVLKNFTKTEQKQLKQIIDQCICEILKLNF